MSNRLKKYVPLILFELYLIFTLMLFRFGAIEWKLKNGTLFYLLIISYHIAFIVGYIGVTWYNRKKIINNKTYKDFNPTIIKFFWILLICALIVACINYRNMTHAKSYIPYELPYNFIQGLLHPSERYYWKLSEEAMLQFNGNKYVTLIGCIFYLPYYFLPAILVFLWEKITKAQKIFAYFIIFIGFSTTISVGTNKILFDLLFLFGGGLLIETVVKFKEKKFQTLKERKVILITVVFLVIFTPIYFTYGIRDRTNNNVGYLANMDEDVSIKTHTDEDEARIRKTGTSEDTFLESLYISFCNYLTQGYYGMSLATEKDFTTTYGLGHSNFIIKTIDDFLDVDINERTYQYKVTDKWDQFARWHSFYGQMANDVSFYGVIIIMLLMGMILAYLWHEILMTDNVVAKCLMVLFVIMCLYMPANNQVGNSGGTFFSFWELMIIELIIILKNRKRRIKN